MGPPPPGSNTDIALPVRLESEGSLLRCPIKFRRENARIVLSQKTRLWFRSGVCLWAVVIVMTPFMIYSELFGATVVRFRCDRDAGTCAIGGRTRDVPRPADVVRAEMDRAFNRRDGANWGINLITRDGKKYAIDEQRGIAAGVVADYRNAVHAINAYVANPAQRVLDISFTYRASRGEKVQSFFYLLFGVGTLLIMGALWTSTAYVFEAERVTLATRSLFQRTAQQMPADRIVGVVDAAAPDGRLLNLKLAGGERISVLRTGNAGAAALADVAREVALLLMKPVERSSG
jgi:hypothetical protein